MMKFSLLRSRTLAWALSVIMVLMLVPVTTLMAEEYVKDEVSGMETVMTFDDLPDESDKLDGSETDYIEAYIEPQLKEGATGAKAGDFTITLTDSGGSPKIADNAPDFDNNDYYYNSSSGVLYINSGAEMTISGTSSADNIVVRATGGDKNLSLYNVNITSGAPFVIAGGVVNLYLLGDNNLTSSGGNAGLHVPYGSTLIIEGTGSLTAQGSLLVSYVPFNLNTGAGIGGNTAESVGNITILGGKIHAKGDYGFAGIGCDLKGSEGNITISGSADVYAEGGEFGGGSGIGGDIITISDNAVVCAKGFGSLSWGIYGGTITISGNAVVTADGTWSNGMGIGASGNITIDGNAVVSAAVSIGPGISGTGINISGNPIVYSEGGHGGHNGISGDSVTISGGTVTAITGRLYTKQPEQPAIRGEKITIDMSPHNFRYWINEKNTDPAGEGTLNSITPFSYSDKYQYIKLEQLYLITITTQPAVRTNVTVGSITGSLTIDAEVSSGIEPTYQWYSSTTASSSGGMLLVGQTSSQFEIPKDLAAGAHYFYCVVSSPGAADVASGVSTVTVAEVNPVEAFITRMYLNVLEREPESEGLEHWSNGLKAGLLTATDIIENFFLSAEFLSRNITHEHYIKIAYNTFMDREPDDDGLSFWLNTLNLGYSRWYVLYCMIISQEFTGICDYYGITLGQMELDSITITSQPAVRTNVTVGSITGSLTIEAEVLSGRKLAYQWYGNATASNNGGTLLIGQTSSCFEIPTDLTAGAHYFYCVVSTSGAAYALRSGVSQVTVAEVNPVEALVTRMYLNVLRRQPEPEVLELWSSGLKSGIFNVSYFIENFFFSPEFLNRNVTNEQFIKITYNILMDREPDGDGLSFWSNMLNLGYSRRYMLDCMMTSQEFTDICDYYGITLFYLSPQD